MNLRKELEDNKSLFMYRVINNETPEYMSNLYRRPSSRYSNSRNYQLSLPRPMTDIFKTSIAFCRAFLWNNLPVTLLVRVYDISNPYTRPSSRYSNSRNYQLSLLRPVIDIFKTSIAFCSAFLWNNIPVTVLVIHSAPSKQKHHAHLEAVKDGL